MKSHLLPDCESLGDEYCATHSRSSVECAYAAGAASRDAEVAALVAFAEAFLRNTDILQEQIGTYSLTLEALRTKCEDALVSSTSTSAHRGWMS